MTIKYFGESERNKGNRIAEISCNDDNEFELAMMVMDEIDGYNYDGFDDCICVQVDDKEDFMEFSKWFREVRKEIKNCEIILDKITKNWK